jgi:HTH-type transcriptional regulator / antitoxin HigA
MARVRELDREIVVIRPRVGNDSETQSQREQDALTDLVEVYEREHEPARTVSEADVLRELMRSHGLSQQALEAKVGIAQSTISNVLNGSRSLTRDQVITLARFFGVKPGAFLPG